MKKILSVIFFCLTLLLTTSCKKDNPKPDPDQPKGYQFVKPEPKEWDGEKRADISYQLLLYSFADKDGDKWGDLGGLIDKLDYLDDMGISALWLSPVHPAMSYHGYDVLDYAAVNPTYGTMADFKDLTSQAHNRDIKIYIDYVLNHTGREHPWFTSASSSQESPYRDYFIFSDDPKADIAAGNIPMIATEGASGYDSGQWFAVSSTQSQKLLFTLDWSNSSSPKITVTRSDKVDPDNTDTSVEKYLYFGDVGSKRFYSAGNNKYTLNVDFSSSWGFLIRTSNDNSWPAGTKYGARDASKSTITFGVPFTLYTSNDNNNVHDVKLPGATNFHSHFWTNWFADLNYGSAATCETSAAFKDLAAIGKTWVDAGIDGMRLDAVKHIYHNARSDENPTFLKKFYTELSGYYKGSEPFYMVGEVFSEHNEVAPYYKGLPALFEFSFWWRLKDAVNNGIGNTFVKDILSYRKEYETVNQNFIEATKLSNHDEARACSDFGGSTAKAKLAGAVLLTAGGSPYIYFGEELGYIGTKNNGDEYVRPPMLWGDNYTTAYTDKVDPSLSATVGTVLTQSADTNSVYKVYRDFARVRNTYPALAQGHMERHGTYNDSNSSALSICAWYMVSGGERVLVLHNFSPASMTIPIEDKIGKALARQGNVYVNRDSSPIMVRMEAYSSVVFEL